MNCKYGELFGKTIGPVQDVEVEHDDIGWGSYLKARIEINLSKSLTQGCLLNIRGEDLWSPIKYEKLPRFCLKCEKITHMPGCRAKDDDMAQSQFGT